MLDSSATCGQILKLLFSALRRLPCITGIKMTSYFLLLPVDPKITVDATYSGRIIDIRTSITYISSSTV